VGHLHCGWPTPSNRHSKSHKYRINKEGAPPFRVLCGGWAAKLPKMTDSTSSRNIPQCHPEAAESLAKAKDSPRRAYLRGEPCIPASAAAMRPTASLDKYEGLEFVSREA